MGWSPQFWDRWESLVWPRSVSKHAHPFSFLCGFKCHGIKLGLQFLLWNKVYIFGEDYRSPSLNQRYLPTTPSSSWTIYHTMSTSKVELYDPAAFTHIPFIKDATIQFYENGLHKLVQSIGALIRDHQLENMFGVCLVHRHFELRDNEKLVEYKGTATPWENGTERTTGGTVTAQSWFYHGDKLVPFEFEYVPPDIEHAIHWELIPAGFLAGLRSLIDTHTSGHLLGLRRYPGDDYPGGVEVTQGRANITFHPEDVTSNIIKRLC